MEILEHLGKDTYSILKANQLKMMEISGVDVRRLQAQQAETAAKMAGVAEKIGAHFREGAPGIAEVHRKALVSHYKIKVAPIPLERAPRPLFQCYPELDEAMDCFKTIELSLLEDPSHVRGDASCDVAQNICRLYLELHGMGPGVPVSAKVTCGLVFCFRDVPCSGHYSIRALTQANGYRLLQLWGSGCGGGVPTSGHLKITVRLCVTQPFDDWGEPDVLVDTTTGGPPAAIDLNRYVGHSAYLRKGYDAFIKVEFKIDAAIDGSGQCYADLGAGPEDRTSEFFYFRVPVVTPCRLLYHPWSELPRIAGLQRFLP